MLDLLYNIYITLTVGLWGDSCILIREGDSDNQILAPKIPYSTLGFILTSALALYSSLCTTLDVHTNHTTLGDKQHTQEFLCGIQKLVV